MSKKNRITKRKTDHEALRRREAELARKRAEKLKRRQENKSDEVVMVNSSTNGLRPLTKKKALRRRAKEIQRLLAKGKLEKDQAQQLLDDTAADIANLG